MADKPEMSWGTSDDDVDDNDWLNARLYDAVVRTKLVEVKRTEDGDAEYMLTKAGEHAGMELAKVRGLKLRDMTLSAFLSLVCFGDEGRYSFEDNPA